jgi:hypothetical protein
MHLVHSYMRRVDLEKQRILTALAGSLKACLTHSADGGGADVT